MKSYTVFDVAHSLNKKSDCRVSAVPLDMLGIRVCEGQVFLLFGHDRANDMGIASWGKVDYLRGKGFMTRSFFHRKEFDLAVSQSFHGERKRFL